jgi:hypothetical protein
MKQVSLKKFVKYFHCPYSYLYGDKDCDTDIAKINSALNNVCKNYYIGRNIYKYYNRNKLSKEFNKQWDEVRAYIKFDSDTIFTIYEILDFIFEYPDVDTETLAVDFPIVITKETSFITYPFSYDLHDNIDIITYNKRFNTIESIIFINDSNKEMNNWRKNLSFIIRAYIDYIGIKSYIPRKVFREYKLKYINLYNKKIITVNSNFLTNYPIKLQRLICETLDKLDSFLIPTPYKYKCNKCIYVKRCKYIKAIKEYDR